ncbi:MAG: hypothetical protein ACOZNI_30475 [Myxococcota bacterium]
MGFWLLGLRRRTPSAPSLSATSERITRFAQYSLSFAHAVA